MPAQPEPTMAMRGFEFLAGDILALLLLLKPGAWRTRWALDVIAVGAGL